MTIRKLVLFSGADRCGKSTLIAEFQQYLGEDICSAYHHGVPDSTSEDIFDIVP
jgi:thymidylate kinase